MKMPTTLTWKTKKCNTWKRKMQSDNPLFRNARESFTSAENTKKDKKEMKK
jgi:hypothetical protein